MESQKKQELVDYYLKNNFLVNESLLALDTPILLEQIPNEVAVICKEHIVANKSSIFDRVKVITSYDSEMKKRVPQDFIDYFALRYKSIEPLLRNRSELANIVSINRLTSKSDRESASIIGMVYEKSMTKNGNIMLTIEDLTGSIKVVITKSNNELFEHAKDLVTDEVIGINGKVGDNIIFGRSIVWPDIPLSNELKKSPDEAYAVFLSDTEFGSKLFLKDSFEKFIKWINGKIGDENQKLLSSKISYLFIVGDLVNGVGIYPGQEKELEIPDIYDQYETLAFYLKQIPSRIPIILCPGNHDAMRIAEPQPKIYPDLAKSVYEMENVIMVSNPAWVNIHSSEHFSGFDVLMYHGFSFIYYGENVESIRTAGGQARVDLIKKFLLKRRHLAPTHTSTLYLPETQIDPLFIHKIPDFFVSGHLHQTSVSQYRNVTLMNCSCWIGQTNFQKKMGITPVPARALIANLKTREVKVMRF